MKILNVLLILLVFSITLLYAIPSVSAQENADSGERVDLPDEPSVTMTPPGDGDNETDDEPPIEFWDTPIEADKVAFVVDRTGYKVPMYAAFALQAASGVMAPA